MVAFNFDATNIPPAMPGVQQLPVSDDHGHLVVITNSEIVTTKDKESGMFLLTVRVTEGPFKGASGPYRLNVFNKSEKTCEIATKQLSAICHCVGKLQWGDSSELHGIPFRVLVRTQPTNDQYTEIYGVLAADGSLPGQGSVPQPQSAPQSNPGPAPGAWNPQGGTSHVATDVPAPGQSAAPAWNPQGAGQSQAPAPDGPAPWLPKQ